MADFKRLQVWAKAHALALNVHRVAARIRGTTFSPVKAQMIRAAMSIPANIVEGRAHESEREFVRFLRIAIASNSELEYHLLVARDIGAIGQSDFISLFGQLIDVRKMLHGLINRIVGDRETAASTPDVARPEGAEEPA